MLLLKGCPRCHGDLMVVTYMDDRSTNCLQCGFSRPLSPTPPVARAKVLQFDDDRRNAARRVRLALQEGA